VLVEFASYLDTGAMERGDSTALATLLQKRAPDIESVGLRADGISSQMIEYARKLAAEAEVLILATRNAHLWPEETKLARELMRLAKNVILVCLANPYDAAALPGANTIICTCGDSTPSLQAAVDALMGDFVPMGRLPVRVGL
jgi:beta-N-acetylhexosaminidase